MSRHSLFLCWIAALLSVGFAGAAAEAAGPYGGNYPGGYYPGYFSGAYSGYSPGSSYYLGRPYPRTSGGFPGGYYPGYFADLNNSYPRNAVIPPVPYVNAYRPPVYLSGAPYDRTLIRQTDEAAPGQQANGGVTVMVLVPADAEVWFDGDSTKQQGEKREFSSPPLTQGKQYSYQVRARWTAAGETVDQTRTAVVHANERAEVDFTRPNSTSRP